MLSVSLGCCLLTYLSEFRKNLVRPMMCAKALEVEVLATPTYVEYLAAFGFDLMGKRRPRDGFPIGGGLSVLWVRLYK